MLGLRRENVAYLPQLNAIDRSFPIDVAAFVSGGLWHSRGSFRSIGKAEQHQLQAILQTVGLTDHAHQNINRLSGGQFQRMLFARMLLQNAHLLLLDEPFVGVDENTIEELLQLLLQLQQQSITIVAVMHDLERVRRYFPTTWLLARELVAAGPTSEVLSADNLLLARNKSLIVDATADVCRLSH